MEFQYKNRGFDLKKNFEIEPSLGMGINIPVEELKLRADDNASTLATQDFLVKNLVYIMNIQEGKLGTMKNT